PLTASARYLMYNGLTSRLGRRNVPLLLLRYEDFVAQPAGTVRRLAAFAGTTPAESDLRFIGSDTVDLLPNHTVDGNPVRFSVGSVPLVADQEWRDQMGRLDRAV